MVTPTMEAMGSVAGMNSISGTNSPENDMANAYAVTKPAAMLHMKMLNMRFKNVHLEVTIST